jgi:TonB family protein
MSPVSGGTRHILLMSTLILGVQCSSSVTVPKAGTVPSSPKTLEPHYPTYPELAVRARMEGVVEIRVTTSQSGAVASAEVSRSLAPLLDQAALAAAREWRFSGAGKTTVIFEFHLGGNSSPDFVPPYTVRVFARAPEVAPFRDPGGEWL